MLKECAKVNFAIQQVMKAREVEVWRYLYLSSVLDGVGG